MIDNIIGSIFFEFIGAFIKWSIYALINKIRGKNITNFKEMWHGRKGSQKADFIMDGASNIIVGISVVLALLIFLNKLYSRFH